jgi:hypothetical protein
MRSWVGEFMTLQERIYARNNKMVFINLETGAFQLEPDEGFDQFHFKFVNKEKLGSARAAIMAQDPQKKDNLLVAAVMAQQQTAQEYREYREREGRPLREDEPLPVFDIEAFNLEFTELLLSRAMIEPTLESLGGIAGIGDFADVLIKVFDSVFYPEAVGEVEVVADTPEIAERFPENDGARVGRTGKKVRENASVVVEPVQAEA